MFGLSPIGSVTLIVGGLILLYSPFIGLLAMLVLIPCEALTTFIAGRTFVWVLGVATFGSWLLRTLGDRSKIRLAPAPTVLVILWLFWGIASSFWAADQASAWSRSLVLAQAITFFFLLQNLVTNDKRLRIVLTAYFAATAIISLFTIGIAVSAELRRAVLAENQSPIHLAQALGIGLLVAPYLFSRLKRLFWKIWIALGAGSLVVAILMTGSRGAWVGLAAATGFTWLVSRGKAIRVRSLVAVGALLVAGIVLLNYYGVITEWTIQRITTLPDVEATRGGSGRINIWRVGWEMVKDNPLIGVGLQNFPARFEDYIEAAGLRGTYAIYPGRDPHSIFLAILGELGVVGFSIVAVFFWAIFKALFLYRGDPRAILGLLLLFYLVITGLATTIQYCKYFWLGIGLATLIPMVIQNERD